MDAPVIVLVEPQLPENIGAAARAMMNFALTELRLVRPRPRWPHPKAVEMASGAGAILERAVLFDTTPAAVADLQVLYASSARLRDMVKPVVTPRDGAALLRGAIAEGRRCGVLFGRERTGLENQDMVLATALMTVPANPAHASLNLAQAVLLVGYEWFVAGAASVPTKITRKGAEPARMADLHGLFDQLEAELDKCGFLHVADKRPRMVRNIRNIFSRAGLTDQEVRTLRGIVSGLTRRDS